MKFLSLAAEEPAPLIVPDSLQKARFEETIEKITNLDLQQVLSSLVSESIWIVLKILLALAIYWVGRWLIRKLIKLLNGIYERRSVDKSLQTFLRNLVKAVCYIILTLLIIQVIGINTTSIVALLASAGLAIGMALSGTLQNFAGGVMILLLKPYRVGDFIEAQGKSGTVEEIMLFSTKISTPAKQIIYIPNSSIATSIIDNYSTSPTRRAEWIVSIAYGDDVETARKAILEILTADNRILQDPAPVVYVAALADSSVNLSVRAWTANDDFWDVFFTMNEIFYKVLPEKGIHFPFPQMDVHLLKE
ncbi:MAG TPA: mechanosensitive ion channel family protein [Candidatus Alistipes avicola]|uniref:Mechanosensitive ion channel family protein n=1 Tax=Candidatus Alistipes avicola TaxID=2838432 RepID=A0A9D2RI38_9BACT|nr:mechanosensitive ion channel family protein [uncultured Alistipes sp.]HJA99421.1 mechanosensitive ion channel family protein [Candidatus Alistipes avicola]